MLPVARYSEDPYSSSIPILDQYRQNSLVILRWWSECKTLGREDLCLFDGRWNIAILWVYDGVIIVSGWLWISDRFCKSISWDCMTPLVLTVRRHFSGILDLWKFGARKMGNSDVSENRKNGFYFLLFVCLSRTLGNWIVAVIGLETDFSRVRLCETY